MARLIFGLGDWPNSRPPREKFICAVFPAIVLVVSTSAPYQATDINLAVALWRLASARLAGVVGELAFGQVG